MPLLAHAAAALSNARTWQGLYIQQVGRGLRSAAGKADCIVLDQAGNTWCGGATNARHMTDETSSRDSIAGRRCHGPVTGPQGWQLESARFVRPSDDWGSVGATRQCPRDAGGCGALVHRTADVCELCGFRLPAAAAAGAAGARATDAVPTDAAIAAACAAMVRARGACADIATCYWLHGVTVCMRVCVRVCVCACVCTCWYACACVCACLGVCLGA